MSEEDPGHRQDVEDAGAAGDYCRHVEAYLCRKNDGHLIRIAGPSFSRVSGWARQGIPLNVVYRGVDRYFERYYARGQRRRPVHIDFCEDDVLAVFDEWRRAVGRQAAGGEEPDRAAEAGETDSGARPARSEGATARRERQDATSRTAAGSHVRAPRRARDEPDASDTRGASAETGERVSLPAHLDRVIVRLTTLRAGGRLTSAADAIVDAVIRELDAGRGNVAHLQGDARISFVDRLRDLDAQLVTALRDGIGRRERRAIEREAETDLQPFRGGMTADAYERAVAGKREQLLRERAGLPVIAYED